MFKLEKAKKNKELNKREMSLRKRKEVKSLYSSSITPKAANTKSKNNTKKVNYNFFLIHIFFILFILLFINCLLKS